MPLSELKVPMSTSGNPFRKLLAVGLLFTVLMFLLKLAAATLIEGEQLQPLLQWLGRSTEASTGLQPALPATPGASDATTPRTASRYQWQALPITAPSPISNPWTPAKARLGKRLFFDANLSLDRSLSCASCHDNERFAGADGRATAVGVGNQSGPRNSPTVWNTAFQRWLFWDGRAASLEEQALGPLLNPIEMAMPSADAVVERVQEQVLYRAAFRQAFAEEKKTDSVITIERILDAIAAYERTLITPDSPYDRYVRGDASALSRQQLRGMALFEELGCVNCHSGPNFSGAGVLAHNTPWRIFPALDTPFEQQYRLTDDVGKAPAGSRKGVWRIPSLRNVADTAPYFHNGSVTELAEAVRIMASAQLGYRIAGMGAKESFEAAFVWSEQSNTLATIQPRQLSEDDIQSIVAFLQALSGEPTSSMDF